MAVSDQERAASQPPDAEPPVPGPPDGDPLDADPPPWAEPDRFTRSPAQRASLAGTLTVLAVVAAILLGSRGLRDFDITLLPYTVGTVFLAFGLAHRCSLWLGGRTGGRAARSFRGLRTAAAALPRRALALIGLRPPTGADAPRRRVAHQLIFWGTLLATVITVPLTWGWLTCTVPDPTGSGYQLRVWGFRILGFDADGLLGWVLFHGLDLAAVLVIAGAGYLLWQRPRDGASGAGARPGPAFLPLIALLTIAVTGLLLTFSALALHGGGYQFLAVLHLAAVVPTLVLLPFGVFTRPLPRPAAARLRPAVLAGLTGPGRQRGAAFACRRCGEAIAPAGAGHAGAERTGADADPLRARLLLPRLGLDRWAAYCGRCRRLLRGDAYFAQPRRDAR
ncbi:MFS transporter [Kitasatospora sp. NBC_01302]|uniref:MFS transporter n=1 Tax=Kitasatospora sp. NBC_01302 TaxID=2903575 RepID=UPI002E0E34CD|nr:MFS transporter [Kitasatospora sp. NBC_01302]